MAKVIPEVRVFPDAFDPNTKGINLRDYIAVCALQSVIAAHGQSEITADTAADKAIEYANALLLKLYREQYK